VLTETETDLRPTIRSCSCETAVFPHLFSIALSYLDFSRPSWTWQTVLSRVSPKRRNVPACKRFIFSFRFFFRFSSDVSPSAVFATLKGRTSRTDRAIRTSFLESHTEHAEASRRTNALHGSRLSQAVRNVYLLHQGCCVSVANWVMSRASGRYYVVGRKNRRKMSLFFRAPRQNDNYFCNGHITQN